jgi:ATP-dependent Lhr-like helicase
VVPASALESLVLPARVVDYSPSMLDELTAAGEVVWSGHGELAAHDGMVSLHPAATADLTLPPVADPEPGGVVDTPLHHAVLAVLADGGAYFVPAVAARVADHLRAAAAATGEDPDGVPRPGQSQVAAAVWDLVWAGYLTNDGLGPLRARLGAGGRRGTGTAHRARTPAPRARPMLRGGRLGLRPGLSRPASALVDVSGHDAGGRWSLLPARETDPTVRAHALAAQLLDRHGVLTRAVAPAEGIAGQFGLVYKVLAALEQAGQVRRGYFVEHLGGSQFALPGAVDQLRSDAKEAVGDDGADDLDGPVPGGRAPATPVVLAATDPANPYGAALAWPALPPPPGTPDRPTTSPAGGSRPSGGPGGSGGSGTTGAAGPPSAAGDGGPPGAVVGAEGGRHRPGRKAGSVVVLVGGALVLYVERGGRTILSFTHDTERLAVAAGGLADAVRAGRLGRTAIQRANGSELLTELSSPLGRALTGAGFAPTPRGLRLRSPA